MSDVPGLLRRCPTAGTLAVSRERLYHNEGCTISGYDKDTYHKMDWAMLAVGVQIKQLVVVCRIDNLAYELVPCELRGEAFNQDVPEW